MASRWAATNYSNPSEYDRQGQSQQPQHQQHQPSGGESVKENAAANPQAATGVRLISPFLAIRCAPLGEAEKRVCGVAFTEDVVDTWATNRRLSQPAATVAATLQRIALRQQQQQQQQRETLFPASAAGGVAGGKTPLRLEEDEEADEDDDPVAVAARRGRRRQAEEDRLLRMIQGNNNNSAAPIAASGASRSVPPPPLNRSTMNAAAAAATTAMGFASNAKPSSSSSRPPLAALSLMQFKRGRYDIREEPYSSSSIGGGYRSALQRSHTVGAAPSSSSSPREIRGTQVRGTLFPCFLANPIAVFPVTRSAAPATQSAAPSSTMDSNSQGASNEHSSPPPHAPGVRGILTANSAYASNSRRAGGSEAPTLSGGLCTTLSIKYRDVAGGGLNMTNTHNSTSGGAVVARVREERIKADLVQVPQTVIDAYTYFLAEDRKRKERMEHLMSRRHQIAALSRNRGFPGSRSEGGEERNATAAATGAASAAAAAANPNDTDEALLLLPSLLLPSQPFWFPLRDIRENELPPSGPTQLEVAAEMAQRHHESKMRAINARALLLSEDMEDDEVGGTANKMKNANAGGNNNNNNDDDEDAELRRAVMEEHRRLSAQQQSLSASALPPPQKRKGVMFGDLDNDFNIRSTVEQLAFIDAVLSQSDGTPTAPTSNRNVSKKAPVAGSRGGESGADHHTSNSDSSGANTNNKSLVETQGIVPLMLEGYDVTVAAIGAPQTGKSYALFGSSGTDRDNLWKRNNNNNSSGGMNSFARINGAASTSDTPGMVTIVVDQLCRAVTAAEAKRAKSAAAAANAANKKNNSGNNNSNSPNNVQAAGDSNTRGDGAFGKGTADASIADEMYSAFSIRLSFIAFAEDDPQEAAMPPRHLCSSSSTGAMADTHTREAAPNALTWAQKTALSAQSASNEEVNDSLSIPTTASAVYDLFNPSTFLQAMGTTSSGRGSANGGALPTEEELSREHAAAAAAAASTAVATNAANLNVSSSMPSSSTRRGGLKNEQAISTEACSAMGGRIRISLRRQRAPQNRPSAVARNAQKNDRAIGANEYPEAASEGDDDDVYRTTVDGATWLELPLTSNDAMRLQSMSHHPQQSASTATAYASILKEWISRGLENYHLAYEAHASTVPRGSTATPQSGKPPSHLHCALFLQVCLPPQAKEDVSSACRAATGRDGGVAPTSAVGTENIGGSVGSSSPRQTLLAQFLPMRYSTITFLEINGLSVLRDSDDEDCAAAHYFGVPVFLASNAQQRQLGKSHASPSGLQTQQSHHHHHQQSASRICNWGSRLQTRSACAALLRSALQGRSRLVVVTTCGSGTLRAAETASVLRLARAIHLRCRTHASRMQPNVGHPLLSLRREVDELRAFVNHLEAEAAINVFARHASSVAASVGGAIGSEAKDMEHFIRAQYVGNFGERRRQDWNSEDWRKLVLLRELVLLTSEVQDASLPLRDRLMRQRRIMDAWTTAVCRVTSFLRRRWLGNAPSTSQSSQQPQAQLSLLSTISLSGVQRMWNHQSLNASFSLRSNLDSMLQQILGVSSNASSPWWCNFGWNETGAQQQRNPQTRLALGTAASPARETVSEVMSAADRIDTAAPEYVHPIALILQAPPQPTPHLSVISGTGMPKHSERGAGPASQSTHNPNFGSIAGIGSGGDPGNDAAISLAGELPHPHPGFIVLSDAVTILRFSSLPVPQHLQCRPITGPMADRWFQMQPPASVTNRTGATGDSDDAGESLGPASDVPVTLFYMPPLSSNSTASRAIFAKRIRRAAAAAAAMPSPWWQQRADGDVSERLLFGDDGDDEGSGVEEEEDDGIPVVVDVCLCRRLPEQCRPHASDVAQARSSTNPAADATAQPCGGDGTLWVRVQRWRFLSHSGEGGGQWVRMAPPQPAPSPIVPSSESHVDGNALDDDAGAKKKAHKKDSKSKRHRDRTSGGANAPTATTMTLSAGALARMNAADHNEDHFDSEDSLGFGEKESDARKERLRLHNERLHGHPSDENLGAGSSSVSRAQGPSSASIIHSTSSSLSSSSSSLSLLALSPAHRAITTEGDTLLSLVPHEAAEGLITAAAERTATLEIPLPAAVFVNGVPLPWFVDRTSAQVRAILRPNARAVDAVQSSSYYAPIQNGGGGAGGNATMSRGTAANVSALPWRNNNDSNAAASGGGGGGGGAVQRVWQQQIQPSYASPQENRWVPLVDGARMMVGSTVIVLMLRGAPPYSSPLDTASLPASMSSGVSGGGGGASSGSGYSQVSREVMQQHRQQLRLALQLVDTQHRVFRAATIVSECMERLAMLRLLQAETAVLLALKGGPPQMNATPSSNENPSRPPRLTLSDDDDDEDDDFDREVQQQLRSRQEGNVTQRPSESAILSGATGSVGEQAGNASTTGPLAAMSNADARNSNEQNIINNNNQNRSVSSSAGFRFAQLSTAYERTRRRWDEFEEADLLQPLGLYQQEFYAAMVTLFNDYKSVVASSFATLQAATAAAASTSTAAVATTNDRRVQTLGGKSEMGGVGFGGYIERVLHRIETRVTALDQLYGKGDVFLARPHGMPVERVSPAVLAAQRQEKYREQMLRGLNWDPSKARAAVSSVVALDDDDEEGVENDAALLKLHGDAVAARMGGGEGDFGQYQEEGEEEEPMTLRQMAAAVWNEALLLHYAAVFAAYEANARWRCGMPDNDDEDEDDDIEKYMNPTGGAPLTRTQITDQQLALAAREAERRGLVQGGRQKPLTRDEQLQMDKKVLETYLDERLADFRRDAIERRPQRDAKGGQLEKAKKPKVTVFDIIVYPPQPLRRTSYLASGAAQNVASPASPTRRNSGLSIFVPGAGNQNPAEETYAEQKDKQLLLVHAFAGPPHQSGKMRDLSTTLFMTACAKCGKHRHEVEHLWLSFGSSPQLRSPDMSPPSAFSSIPFYTPGSMGGANNNNNSNSMLPALMEFDPSREWVTVPQIPPLPFGRDLRRVMCLPEEVNAALVMRRRLPMELLRFYAEVKKGRLWKQNGPTVQEHIGEYRNLMHGTKLTFQQTIDPTAPMPWNLLPRKTVERAKQIVTRTRSPTQFMRPGGGGVPQTRGRGFTANDAQRRGGSGGSSPGSIGSPMRSISPSGHQSPGSPNMSPRRSSLPSPRPRGMRGSSPPSLTRFTQPQSPRMQGVKISPRAMRPSPGSPVVGASPLLASSPTTNSPSYAAGPGAPPQQQQQPQQQLPSSPAAAEDAKRADMDVAIGIRPRFHDVTSLRVYGMMYKLRHRHSVWSKRGDSFSFNAITAVLRGHFLYYFNGTERPMLTDPANGGCYLLGATIVAITKTMIERDMALTGNQIATMNSVAAEQQASGAGATTAPSQNQRSNDPNSAAAAQNGASPSTARTGNKKTVTFSFGHPNEDADTTKAQHGTSAGGGSVAPVAPVVSSTPHYGGSSIGTGRSTVASKPPTTATATTTAVAENAAALTQVRTMSDEMRSIASLLAAAHVEEYVYVDENMVATGRTADDGTPIGRRIKVVRPLQYFIEVIPSTPRGAVKTTLFDTRANHILLGFYRREDWEMWKMRLLTASVPLPSRELLRHISIEYVESTATSLYNTMQAARQQQQQQQQQLGRPASGSVLQASPNSDAAAAGGKGSSPTAPPVPGSPQLSRSVSLGPGNDSALPAALASSNAAAAAQRTGASGLRLVATTVKEREELRTGDTLLLTVGDVVRIHAHSRMMRTHSIYARNLLRQSAVRDGGVRATDERTLLWAPLETRSDAVARQLFEALWQRYYERHINRPQRDDEYFYDGSSPTLSNSNVKSFAQMYYDPRTATQQESGSKQQHEQQQQQLQHPLSGAASGAQLLVVALLHSISFLSGPAAAQRLLSVVTHLGKVEENWKNRHTHEEKLINRVDAGLQRAIKRLFSPSASTTTNEANAGEDALDSDEDERGSTAGNVKSGERRSDVGSNKSANAAVEVPTGDAPPVVAGSLPSTARLSVVSGKKDDGMDIGSPRSKVSEKSDMGNNKNNNNGDEELEYDEDDDEAFSGDDDEGAAAAAKDAIGALVTPSTVVPLDALPFAHYLRHAFVTLSVPQLRTAQRAHRKPEGPPQEPPLNAPRRPSTVSFSFNPRTTSGGEYASGSVAPHNASPFSTPNEKQGQGGEDSNIDLEVGTYIPMRARAATSTAMDMRRERRRLRQQREYGIGNPGVVTSPSDLPQLSDGVSTQDHDMDDDGEGFNDTYMRHRRFGAQSRRLATSLAPNTFQQYVSDSESDMTSHVGWSDSEADNDDYYGNANSGSGFGDDLDASRSPGRGGSNAPQDRRRRERSNRSYRNRRERQMSFHLPFQRTRLLHIERIAAERYASHVWWIDHFTATISCATSAPQEERSHVRRYIRSVRFHAYELLFAGREDDSARGATFVASPSTETRWWRKSVMGNAARFASGSGSSEKDDKQLAVLQADPSQRGRFGAVLVFYRDGQQMMYRDFFEDLAERERFMESILLMRPTIRSYCPALCEPDVDAAAIASQQNTVVSSSAPNTPHDVLGRPVPPLHLMGAGSGHSASWGAEYNQDAHPSTANAVNAAKDDTVLGSNSKRGVGIQLAMAGADSVEGSIFWLHVLRRLALAEASSAVSGSPAMNAPIAAADNATAAADLIAHKDKDEDALDAFFGSGKGAYGRTEGLTSGNATGDRSQQQQQQQRPPSSNLLKSVIEERERAMTAARMSSMTAMERERAIRKDYKRRKRQLILEIKHRQRGMYRNVKVDANGANQGVYCTKKIKGLFPCLAQSTDITGVETSATETEKLKQRGVIGNDQEGTQYALSTSQISPAVEKPKLSDHEELEALLRRMDTLADPLDEDDLLGDFVNVKLEGTCGFQVTSEPTMPLTVWTGTFNLAGIPLRNNTTFSNWLAQLMPHVTDSIARAAPAANASQGGRSASMSMKGSETASVTASQDNNNNNTDDGKMGVFPGNRATRIAQEKQEASRIHDDIEHFLGDDDEANGAGAPTTASGSGNAGGTAVKATNQRGGGGGSAARNDPASLVSTTVMSTGLLSAQRMRAASAPSANTPGSFLAATAPPKPSLAFDIIAITMQDVTVQGEPQYARFLDFVVTHFEKEGYVAVGTECLKDNVVLLVFAKRAIACLIGSITTKEIPSKLRTLQKGERGAVMVAVEIGMSKVCFVAVYLPSQLSTAVIDETRVGAQCLLVQNALCSLPAGVPVSLLHVEPGVAEQQSRLAAEAAETQAASARNASVTSLSPTYATAVSRIAPWNVSTAARQNISSPTRASSTNYKSEYESAMYDGGDNTNSSSNGARSRWDLSTRINPLHIKATELLQGDPGTYSADAMAYYDYVFLAGDWGFSLLLPEQTNKSNNNNNTSGGSGAAGGGGGGGAAQGGGDDTRRTRGESAFDLQQSTSQFASAMTTTRAGSPLAVNGQKNTRVSLVKLLTRLQRPILERPVSLTETMQQLADAIEAKLRLARETRHEQLISAQLVDPVRMELYSSMAVAYGWSLSENTQQFFGATGGTAASPHSTRKPQKGTNVNANNAAAVAAASAVARSPYLLDSMTLPAPSTLFARFHDSLIEAYRGSNGSGDASAVYRSLLTGTPKVIRARLTAVAARILPFSTSQADAMQAFDPVLLYTGSLVQRSDTLHALRASSSILSFGVQEPAITFLPTSRVTIGSTRYNLQPQQRAALRILQDRRTSSQNPRDARGGSVFANDPRLMSPLSGSIGGNVADSAARRGSSLPPALGDSMRRPSIPGSPQLDGARAASMRQSIPPQMSAIRMMQQRKRGERVPANLMPLEEQYGVEDTAPGTSLAYSSRIFFKNDAVWTHYAGLGVSAAEVYDNVVDYWQFFAACLQERRTNDDITRRAMWNYAAMAVQANNADLLENLLSQQRAWASGSGTGTGTARSGTVTSSTAAPMTGSASDRTAALMQRRPASERIVAHGYTSIPPIMPVPRPKRVKKLSRFLKLSLSPISRKRRRRRAYARLQRLRRRRFEEKKVEGSAYVNMLVSECLPVSAAFTINIRRPIISGLLWSRPERWQPGDNQFWCVRILRVRIELPVDETLSDINDCPTKNDGTELVSNNAATVDIHSILADPYSMHSKSTIARSALAGARDLDEEDQSRASPKRVRLLLEDPNSGLPGGTGVGANNKEKMYNAIDALDNGSYDFWLHGRTDPNAPKNGPRSEEDNEDDEGEDDPSAVRRRQSQFFPLPDLLSILAKEEELRAIQAAEEARARQLQEEHEEAAVTLDKLLADNKATLAAGDGLASMSSSSKHGKTRSAWANAASAARSTAAAAAAAAANASSAAAQATTTTTLSLAMQSMPQLFPPRHVKEGMHCAMYRHVRTEQEMVTEKDLFGERGMGVEGSAPTDGPSAAPSGSKARMLHSRKVLEVHCTPLPGRTDIGKLELLPYAPEYLLQCKLFVSVLLECVAGAQSKKKTKEAPELTQLHGTAPIAIYDVVRAGIAEVKRRTEEAYRKQQQRELQRESRRRKKDYVGADDDDDDDDENDGNDDMDADSIKAGRDRRNTKTAIGGAATKRSAADPLGILSDMTANERRGGSGNNNSNNSKNSSKNNRAAAAERKTNDEVVVTMRVPIQRGGQLVGVMMIDMTPVICGEEPDLL